MGRTASAVRFNSAHPTAHHERDDPTPHQPTPRERRLCATIAVRRVSTLGWPWSAWSRTASRSPTQRTRHARRRGLRYRDAAADRRFHPRHALTRGRSGGRANWKTRRRLDVPGGGAAAPSGRGETRGRRNLRCHATKPSTSSTPRTRRRFEPTSKRRRGFPSETRVKRGARAIRRGEVELLERLGNNDLCPCGSGRRFQEVLPQ